MASSFLSPPNSHALSDQVIGGVVQRVGSRLGRTEAREISRYTQPRQTFSYEGESRQKHQPDLDSLADLATNRPTVVASLTKEREGFGKRKLKVSSSRRERCRVNQARYRKRQRQYAENLDESISSLEQEIQELENERQDILCRAPSKDSVWVVATEFFRLFRYGYMAPMMAPERKSVLTDSEGKRRPQKQKSHVQLDFFKSTMAKDVTDGDVCGAEALLENWRLLSLYFGDVHVQPKRLEQVSTDSLLASTVTTVTITENTLQSVFPHLLVSRDLEGEATSVWSPLAAKLLNQRLVLHGSVRFDWDAALGRVNRVESKTDLLTPLLKLLGNLEDVATVLEKALVTPEGKMLSTRT